MGFNVMTTFFSTDPVAREMAELALTRQAGTAAQADVGTAPGNVVQLDEEGRLPDVDGSRLTGLAVSGGGATETPVEDSAGSGYSALDVQARTFVPAPAPEPAPATNFALRAADYRGSHGTAPQEEVTVLGAAGRAFVMGAQGYHHLLGMDVTPDLHAGQTLYVVGALKHISGSNTECRLYAKAGGTTDKVEFTLGADGDIIGTAWDKAPFGSALSKPMSSEDAFNKVTLVGDVHVFQLRIKVLADVPGGLQMGPAISEDGASFHLAMLYAGLTPYDPFATDGSEVVLLPDGKTVATLTLGNDSNYVATITRSGTVLELPPPPSSGVRRLLLDLTVEPGASLVLPIDNVFRVGDTPAELNERCLIGIRQKADGTAQIGSVCLVEG